MEAKRSSTPSTPKCSSNPSNYFQGSDNNLNKTSNAIQTPPTENIASTRTPIPSHDMQSSSHDTHNVSPTRDLTTTFAASASQQSGSTPPNALNQTIAQDPLNRKKDKTSPGDKPSQSWIATNPLQDVQYPVTVIHNVESNGLNSVSNSKANLKSKPTVDSPESTTIKRSRSSFSSTSTSTVNNLSCTTSSVPPNMSITSENLSPGQEVKTPPTPSPRMGYTSGWP